MLVTGCNPKRLRYMYLEGTCKLRNGKNEKKRKETERKKTKRKQGEK